MRTADVNLLGVLDERAAAHPDRVWSIEVDGGTLDYGSAATESRRWAGAYRRLGVGRGDHVVTMQHNGVDSLLGWLGLSWLGAVEAPVNTDYRGGLLAHALNLTEARCVAVLGVFAPRLAEVAAELEHLERVVVLDDADVGDLPFEVVTRDAFLGDLSPLRDLELPRPWDIGAVLFTSGTTGPSKAVRLPWAQLHATATGTFPFEDLGADDVFYNPGPTYHVGAKVFPFVSALVGGRQVLRPYISLTNLARDIVGFGVTTGLSLAPAMIEAAEAETGQKLALRNLLAPYKTPGLDELKARYGWRSFGCFNMTEVSIPIRDRTWDAARFDEMGRMSCGHVRDGYPDYEVRIVDDDDQPVDPGEIGELVVRASAPWTMNAGYLNMPDATAAAWRNGWFHTGDAMVCDHEGRFYFVDRMKDCIRRRSENISSFDVETYVSEHPAVQESAAVAVKQRDEAGADEEVKITVVPRAGEEISPAELIHWLVPRMPRFMVPRYVDVVDALPRTPTMKVRKVELRERGITAATFDRVAAGIDLPREPAARAG